MNPLARFLFSVRSAPVAVPMAIPAAPAVESLVVADRAAKTRSVTDLVGRGPLPPHVHPLLARHDLWADLVHDGSPDLGVFPPSLAEDFYASRVLHAPDDVTARTHLRSLAQSDLRCAALLRDVRRRRDAQQVLERIAP